MTHASLFSGIGGPEVAAAMMGWKNAFHCEINPFGRAVLDYWFPESKSYEDITKTSFKEWRGRIDVLTGGFPCQPFSYAGKRGGRDDDRYLWPEMLRVIDEVRPTWVVGENVAGITTMVEGGILTPLGGESSLFAEGDNLHRYELDQSFTIERICKDLEGLGYSVQSVLIPAAGVGAPHRRDRVFILAHDDANHTDCGADDRPAGEDEGAQGEERVSERDNLHLSGDSSEVRSEVRGSAEDSERVRWSGGVPEEEPDIRGFGVSCSRGDERVCGEERFDATDTDGHPGRCLSNQGREEDLPRREEGGRVLRSTPRFGGEWSSSDPELLRLQHNLERGSEGGVSGETGEGGEDGISAEVQLSAPEGEGGFVADSTGFGPEGRDYRTEGWETEDGSTGQPCSPGLPSQTESGDYRGSIGTCPGERFLAHAFGIRRGHPREYDDGEPTQPQQGERGELQPRGATGAYDRWREFPLVSPVHRGNDGIPFPLDNLTIPQAKWRTESLKAYGNAIVPQVMYRIFQAIETAENQSTT